MSIKLSIIIVNYEVANEIRNSIHSIQKHLTSLPFEIIVVDNNSTDREIEKLRDEFTDVQFALLKENTGFSAGNNTGFKLCTGEFVLFLNPDTLFIEDCVTPLIQFLQEHDDVGICTPMLVYEDLSFQYSWGFSRSMLMELSDALYFTSPIYEYITTTQFKRLFDKKKPFEIGWTSGAFMLMRSSVYRACGGFSNEYKLNYEDMDLCYRLCKMGHRIFYFPNYRCIHLESQSQGKKEFYNYIYQRYLGRLTYSNLHFSKSVRPILWIASVIGLLLRISAVGIVYKGSERKERFRAFKDSLRLYLGLQKK